MKTTFTVLLTCFLLLYGLGAQAQTIRRCNNTGVTGANVYATLQAAHDAASNGDIIYLEPTSVSYGNLDCHKMLAIIETGYFLAQTRACNLTRGIAGIPAVPTLYQYNESVTGNMLNVTISTWSNN